MSRVIVNFISNKGESVYAEFTGTQAEELATRLLRVHEFTQGFTDEEIATCPMPLDKMVANLSVAVNFLVKIVANLEEACKKPEDWAQEREPFLELTREIQAFMETTIAIMKAKN